MKKQNLKSAQLGRRTVLKGAATLAGAALLPTGSNVAVPSGGVAASFSAAGESTLPTDPSNLKPNRSEMRIAASRTLMFSFPAESGGQRFDMSFTAKVQDAESMSGTIDFSGMADGTFTAKKAKP